MAIAFSDITNKSGIIQLCEIFTGLGDGNISGNVTLLKQFTRLINNAFQKHISTILESEDDWDFDDSSLTGNYPIATRPLVAGQRDYKFSTGLWSLLYPESSTTGNVFTVTIAGPAVFTCANHGLNVNDAIQLSTTGALPTGLSAATTYYVISTGYGANVFEVSATLGGTGITTSGSQSGTHTFTQSISPLKIKRVDFTFDGTNWNQGNPLDPSTIRVGLGNDTNVDNQFMKTRPYYDIADNALWVYPTAVSSDVSMGAKLRIMFWRQPTEFLSGDTAKTLPVETAFASMVPLDACIDYAMINIPSVLPTLQGRYADLEARLRRFQSTKNEDDDYQMRPRYQNMN